MKRSIDMKTQLKPVTAAVALALTASPTWALTDFYLAAKQYTKYLPDGSVDGFPVSMWGYVADTDGVCYGITGAGSATARVACVDALPDPTVPGPRLEVPPGEINVRIFLTNALPEPTSIVIPGQEMPFSDGSAGGNQGPTWDDGSTGGRSSATQRVRSFGREANPNGGRRVYVWTTGRRTPFSGPGTFLYHSGTHPQKQVYMGLAGLITEDAAAGEAYPNVPYNNDVMLFYSDIDPAFNEAVATGTLATAVDRHPTWFLVNGEPYEANVTAGIDAGAVGENVLLRLASTAADTHVAVLQGLNMTIHAEDGQQYNYQQGGVSTPAPRVQYSAMLPPAKTKDAIVVAPLQGSYAVYDGNGYMTNPSDPAEEAVGDEVGGMLRFLAFGGGGNNQAPTANDDAASVVEGFSVNINVLGNDTDPESDPLSIASFDATAGLTCAIGVVAGSCTYNATGVTAGLPVSFTYVATDGPNTSNPATVTVTVTENQPPTASDDTATTDQGGPTLAIDVLANDSDPEGVDLEVATVDTTGTAGTVDCTALTSCSYTPLTGFSGDDTFTYTVTDGVNESAPATVTVAVVAPNVAPTAVDDAVSTSINTQLTGIDVLANDTDLDGGPSPLTIASFDATGTASGTVACVTGVSTGTCTYTPPTDYTGADTFTYTITDGVDQSTATVTVTVNPADVPALYFSTSGAGSLPGVAGPYDDADVYTVDAGDVYSRLYDAVTDLGLPNGANIDGMSIDGDVIYLSFAAASTNVPTLGGVPDEDVVTYNTATGEWGPYFDGSLCGLDAANGGDVDAVSVVATTLYFSTVGNVSVSGLGNGDDADVYSWVEGAGSCTRVLNAANGPGGNIGLPGNADIDGLTVAGGTYYMSFNRNGGTAVPGPGTVQDEAVVTYDSGTGTWATFRANAELSATISQDLDAIHVPTTP